MALQILRQPSASNEIGQLLGSGLGQGIQSLAHLKFNQMQQRELGKQLQAGGLPAVLAYLDPQVQASYLREYGASQNRSQQDQSQALAEQYLQQAEQGNVAPEQIMALLSQQGQGGQQELPESLQGSAQQPQQQAMIPQNVAQQLQQRQQAPQINALDMLMKSLQPQGVQMPQLQAAMQQQKQIQPEQMRAKQAQEEKTAIDQSQLQKAQEKVFKQLSKTPETKLKSTIDSLDTQLRSPSINPNVKSILRKRRDEEQKQFSKLRDRNFDKTEKLRSEINLQEENAKELTSLLDRQKELNEKGDMNYPGTLMFLENMGLDSLDSLKTADTQEFIKNNGTFLKNLKQYFGGRITDNEVNQFMKTIPNVYQSPEGRRRIIASLQVAAQASLARAQAMDSIIEANGGIPPITLERDISKVAGPLIDRYKKEFLEDIKKTPLENPESSIGAAAKGIAGTVLGKGLKAVIPGAIGYSLAGAPGAIAGGLTGLGALKGLFK